MSSVIELNEQLERILGKNRTVSKNGNRHKTLNSRGGKVRKE